MRLILLGAVLLALAGCGSDGESDGSAETTTSGAAAALTADDVEEAFRSKQASGDGVVELGNERPKLVECEKSAEAGAWDCRVTPAKGGRTMLCMVVTDPTTRTVTSRRCAPVDY